MSSTIQQIVRSENGNAPQIESKRIEKEIEDGGGGRNAG
jgi:hypothetical protein